MKMLYVCVFCASCGSPQCCVLHYLQFVNAGRGCKRRPYGNNTVAKGFNQMSPPARTINVALNMSKAFNTINMHILIRKLLQTKIPGTIIKLIPNYIKGRNAYTTYRNHTSSQRQFKTGVPQGGVPQGGVPQGGVLSPILCNIYTADIPPPSAPMAYTDDITITSTHTSSQEIYTIIPT